MRITAPILLAALPFIASGQAVTHSFEPSLGSVTQQTASTSVIILEQLGSDVPEVEPSFGARFRYGVPRPLDISFMEVAEWSTTQEGSMLGSMTIVSPGAASLNVFFSTFHLAGSAYVEVRGGGEDPMANTYGAQANPWGQGKLQTALLPGDEVVIEFHGSLEEKEASNLEIGNVVHGLFDLFNGQESAMATYDCLVDAACPQGDDWRTEIRSVVMFTREDGEGCTGVLLNNTAQDGTPYIFAAHHCRGSFNPNNWVFYFNFQKPTCNGGTATPTQAIYGAQLVASDYSGDFDLLRLQETPPASYQPYYAGWDRTAAAPESGVILGHPLAGPMKITTWSNATTTSFPGYGKPVWEVNILQGGIAGGSSGSPMFNAGKRVIGVAQDGDVGCSAGIRHAAGTKLSANWEGQQPSRRLKDWLDPAGTGALFLDGMDPADNGVVESGTEAVQVKVKVCLQGAFEAGTGMMRAQLNLPTTEPYTTAGYEHVLHGGNESTTTSVLQAGGAARIVDWVVIELRKTTYPYAVVATRCGLLRRDGQVAEVNGSLNGLLFQDLPSTNYRVAVRHRNHLGIMSNTAVDLAAGNLVDFASTGGISLYGSQATTVIGNTRCMWMGDVDMNGSVKYTGVDNDRDQILTRLGGAVNAVVTGYFEEDANLDGVVKYTGVDNDRDALWNVMGGDPVYERNAQLP